MAVCVPAQQRLTRVLSFCRTKRLATSLLNKKKIQMKGDYGRLIIPGIVEAKLDGSIDGLSHQGWT